MINNKCKCEYLWNLLQAEFRIVFANGKIVNKGEIEEKYLYLPGNKKHLFQTRQRLMHKTLRHIIAENLKRWKLASFQYSKNSTKTNVH